MILIGSALAVINYLVMAYLDVFRDDVFDPAIDAPNS